jgi:predicted ATPase/class 3 adenylate cyclase
VKQDSENGQGSAADRSERRLLTVLCYDLVGSTDLLRKAGAEEYHELISAFQAEARQALTARSGVLLADAGDGGIALFPWEIDAKDAASLAIHAGLDLVEACRELGVERRRSDLHVRVGIASSIALLHGERVAQAAPDSVTALALALATRLQSMAEPDTVLASNRTRSLARRSHVFARQGMRQLKGFEESESVWRVLGRRREVDRFLAFGRINAPLIGRADELRSMRAAWDRAVAGHGGVVLIEGEAGIGKSRLLRELRRQARRQRTRVLQFQCLPGAADSTLNPMLQTLPGFDGGPSRWSSVQDVAALFKRYGVDDPDVVDVFAFLLGAADAAGGALKDAAHDVVQQRVDWAVQRALELVCAGGPALLAVEDVHWIDPTSRRLLRKVAALAGRCPLLLVLTTRPKAADEWLRIAGLDHIRLRSLDPHETRLAVAGMRPSAATPAAPDLLESIHRITGGMPLLIEEICQWMVENPGRGEAQLATAIAPDGSSILQAILDVRLGPLGRAREVAQAAAVAGPRCNLSLLCAMLPDLDAVSIADALQQLSEVGILAAVKSAADETFGFRHALIQETIEGALLRKPRRGFHRRLYAAVSDRPDLAPWITPATLAGHAEQAGLIEEAIGRFVAAGVERSARSAMAEAQSLLEHALELCERIDGSDLRERLTLSALAALGPVLTSTEGSGSPRAQKLYDEGVEIARRRPPAERAALFPLYWGWWFTGADVDNKRAQELLDELKDVDDPEIQLQLRHCVWAVDFYLGRHERCVGAVNAGMSLYGGGHGRGSVTLFGGHDAKVCGLSHRGLSEWLTGRVGSALRSVREACDWALETGHVGSIAHAYHNLAMLHCYRRDFPALRAAIDDFRRLTAKHSLRSLAATFEIFEGWCIGNAGDARQGQEKIRKGLAVHAELQTPEDYPVYCSMLAELLAQTGQIEEGLELLSRAEAQAEQSGHRYWLAALYHRRARLLAARGAEDAALAAALGKSLEIALAQNALSLLLDAFRTLVSLGVSPALEARYRPAVEQARSLLETDSAAMVNPEPVPPRRRVVG